MLKQLQLQLLPPQLYQSTDNQYEETSALPEAHDQTCEIVKDIIYYKSVDHPAAAPSRPARILRKLVDDVMGKYAVALKGMVGRLNLVDGPYGPTISKIIDEIFADGSPNWGRVVSLVAFAGTIAVNYRKSHGSMTEEQITNLASVVSDNMEQKLGSFFREHGGWTGFCEHFESGQNGVDGFSVASASKPLLAMGLNLMTKALLFAKRPSI